MLVLRGYRKQLQEKIIDPEIRETAAKVLDEMQNAISNATAKIKQIEDSDIYTAKGKSEKIGEIKRKLHESLQNIRSENQITRERRNEVALAAVRLKAKLEYDPGKAAVYSEIRQRILSQAPDAMLLETALLDHAGKGHVDVINAFLHDPLQETSRELLNRAVERLQPAGNPDLEIAVNAFNQVAAEHAISDDEITITARGEE